MFGMGFTEILMIAVVAVLFLGPDKLPEAMVQIGKFINSFRKTINEAKSTFEEELHISELREEALNYRKTLREATDDISGFKNAVPNPAKELEEALNVARSGLGNLDDGDRLHEDEDAEEERKTAEREQLRNNVTEYKEMARKALEKAHASRELSTETPESSAQESFDASEKLQAESEPPRGFKNLDNGKAG